MRPFVSLPHSLSRFLVIGATAFALQACTPIIIGGGAAVYNVFKDEDVNLNAKNVAAADFLHQQAETFLTHKTEIKAIALNNTEQPDLQAKLGREIALHVGSRFSQLGYQTDISEVQDNKIGSVEIKSFLTNTPDFVLTGNYTVERRNLDITLRMVEVETGRLIGNFNYRIPKNYAISQMSEPEVQILRTSSQGQSQPN